MSWSFTHRAGSTTTDITGYVRPEEVVFSITGNPVAQSLELRLYNTGFFEPVANAKIQVLNDGGSPVFTGWVTGITRGDAGDAQVAGLAPTWRLLVSDIYERLKAVYFPMAGEKRDGHLYATTELELPVGLRNTKNAADPGALNKTAQQVFGWILDTIGDVEGRKSSGTRIPDVWSVSRAAIANPTTKIPKPGGGTEDFRFRYCPLVLDGVTYFDALDNTAKLAGLLWRIRPDLTLETWDATAPATLADEVRDGTVDLNGDAPVRKVAGSIWHDARTIEVTEELAQIANRITATYVPKGATEAKSVTVVDSASQTAYGVREKRITTDGTFAATASAAARRALATSKDPNLRGTVRVRYSSAFVPGRFVWLHRTQHADGAGYWTGKAYLAGIRVVFERGVDSPVWADLDFSRDPQDNPGFRAFVPAKDGGGGGGGKGDGDKGGGTTATVPLSGTVYFVPLIPYWFHHDPWLHSNGNYQVAMSTSSNTGLATKRYYASSLVTGTGTLVFNQAGWRPATKTGNGLMPLALGFSLPWTTEPAGGITHARVYIPWAQYTANSPMSAVAIGVRPMTKRPDTIGWTSTWNPLNAADANTIKAQAYHNALVYDPYQRFEHENLWSIASLDLRPHIKANTVALGGPWPNGGNTGSFGATVGKLGAYVSIVPVAIATPSAADGTWSSVVVGSGQIFTDNGTVWPEQAYLVDMSDTRFVFDTYTGTPVRRQLNFDVANPNTWANAMVPFALIRIGAGDLPYSGDSHTQLLPGAGPWALEAAAKPNTVVVNYDKTRLVLGTGYSVTTNDDGNVTGLRLLFRRAPRHTLKVSYEVA